MADGFLRLYACAYLIDILFGRFTVIVTLDSTFYPHFLRRFNHNNPVAYLIQTCLIQDCRFDE